jgi:hypothetical protein
LKSEIEEDPQKEARAKELKNKVEKKTMAKSANVNYSGPFNGVVKKSNGDFEAVVVEAERRLGIYNKATDWSDSDLTKLHPSIEKKKDGLSDFEPWKKKAEDYMGKKVEEFKGKVNDLKTAKEANNEAATQKAEEDLQQATNDADEGNEALEAAINSDATVDTQTGGDSGTGPESTNTDQATIEAVLSNLGSSANAFPTLLANEPFSQLLMLSINAASDAVSSDSGGTTDQDQLDSQNDDIPVPADEEGLQEALSGIYLTEEGVKEPVGDQKAGETKPAMSVEDATKLRDEIQKMQELFKTSDNGNIKNIDVMDLAKKAFGEIPEAGVAPSAVPSVEEAKEEGQSAAQDDAELEDARYQDLYIGFKEQMDTFFSLDGKNDGFMDQFLLKYQGAKLAALIGNLDDIIRGDVPKDGEDNSGEARALSRATQQADNNLNEEQGQEISEKGQLELKTRLIAMLKGIKSLKAMMNSYKKNATRSSANPKLDGSALKKSLQRYMSNLQINIKAIVETCYIEHSKLTQTKSDDVDLNEPSGDEPTQPPADDTSPTVEPQQSAQNEQLYEAILEAIAPALEGVSLMEDAAREEKMALVNTTYDQMEQIYESSMQSALEKSQKETAMKNASQMMEFAKKEEFVALFPTFTGTFGGKPQTIDQATDAIDGLLRDFIETMKKVIVLAKGATIDETTLSKVIEDLSMMSLMMQNHFGVKSLLDDDMQAKVEKMLAQREENQSLSENPKPSTERSSGGTIGKAKDLVGKGLEKLKQMFSWMNEETRKLLLKFFGEESELIDGLSNLDLTEEQQQVFTEEIIDSKSWYEALEQDAKSAVDALVKYLINAVGRDSLKKLNYPAVVSEKLNDEERISISKFAQDTQATFGKELSNLTYRFLHGADEEIKASSMKIMINQTDDLVSYLTTIFKIVDKISDEAAEEMVSAPNDPNPGMTGPSDAKAKADSKPEEEAEEEKDDATDITALKTPITNQWAQFGNEWLKLSDKARGIIPDLAGELALKFIEEGAESLSPKPSPEVEQGLEEVLGFSMKEKVAKTISEVEKELRSTKNERFSGNSPWAFYSGPSSEAGADDDYRGVRGKRSKSIAIKTSMSILNANKDKIEKMLKVSKKKDIIVLLKQMVLTKGVPALLGTPGIDLQDNLLSNPFMKQYKDSIEFREFSASLDAGYADEPDVGENRQPESLEEALRPIIEKMLNEHYNH